MHTEWWGLFCDEHFGLMHLKTHTQLHFACCTKQTENPLLSCKVPAVSMTFAVVQNLNFSWDIIFAVCRREWFWPNYEDPLFISRKRMYIYRRKCMTIIFFSYPIYCRGKAINTFHKNFVEKKSKHICVQKLSFENQAIYETTWKYIVE
jgi:hypothetical protein